ncbi:MAG: xanthine dehydrogenase family protein molybdopterin-binding subunit, partial [Rhodothermales bacterium]
MTDYIGSPVKRVEDKRFLTGRGRYTDDIVLPNMAYAVIVRSPYGHARINSISTEAARNHPGVVAVFTGQDIAADGINPIPTGWQIGENMKEPPHHTLAIDKVRHVGDGVAVVIAERKAEARDAADLVEIDYEVLDAVVDASEALEDGVPLVHEGAPNNLSFEWELGDRDATDQALAQAHHVTTYEFVNQRLIPNAI